MMTRDVSRRAWPFMFLWILVCCGSLAHAQSPNEKCATLAAQSLPDTQIDAAHAITVGSFTVPGSTNQISNLPPFCRVAGVIAPTADSRIRFEVWMPLDKWNGRLNSLQSRGQTIIDDVR